MKKYLALLLVLVMVLSLAACASKPAETTDEPEQTTTEPAPAEETKDEEPAPAEETKEEEPTEEPADNTEYAVAMITDYGDITDQSFNQTTYEACKAFCEDNGVEFSYFKPAGDNTADRVAMIEKAVDEGYNVIVMPGYAFGGAIVEAAPEFPDVKFIALDVAKGDLLEAGVAKAGESYDYNPDNWDLEKYVDMSNVYCAIYQEELCGYMAGYAAVKLGYKSLGFLGGMAVPAVIRYGYGFVQGVDAAAADMGLTDVKVNYIYGGQFFGDADITAVMDTWYAGGTEIVSMILHKYIKVEIGRAILLSDIGTVLFAACIYGPQTGMYCVLGLIGRSTIVDTAIESLNLRKVCTVITSRPEPIRHFVTETLGRTATQQNATGVYTGEPRTMIMVALTRRQAGLLRDFLRREDPEAFLTIVNSSEIIGKGFQSV